MKRLIGLKDYLLLPLIELMIHLNLKSKSSYLTSQKKVLVTIACTDLHNSLDVVEDSLEVDWRRGRRKNKVTSK